MKIIIPFILCLLVSCDPIWEQDLRTIFADGKLPAGLLRALNRTWDQDKAKIQKRKKEDAQNSHILRVGVIDSGIQIYHEDLIDQIDFKLDAQGNVVSAGLDILGADKFPDPTYGRFELYAFAAENVINGKISNPNANPLEFMDQLNKEFMQGFLAKLNATGEFKGTAFERINDKNFTLYSALAVVSPKLMKDIDDIIKNDKEEFIDASTTYKGEKIYNNFSIYKLFSDDLALSKSGGMPEVEGLGFSVFQYRKLKKMKEFYTLLEKEVKAFKLKSKLDSRLNNLVSFLEARNYFSNSVTTEGRKQQAIEKLNNMYYYKKQGYKSDLEVRKFTQQLREAATKHAFRKRFVSAGIWPTEKIVLSKADLKETFKLIVALALRLNNTAVDSPEMMDDGEHEIAELNKENLKIHFNGLEKILEQADWDLTKLNESFDKMDIASGTREYIVRTKHPLFDEKSIGNIHGTHVSGIIAKQNEDIRIFPMRVVTETMLSSKLSDDAEFQRYETMLATWLAKPLVKEAIIHDYNKKFTSGGDWFYQQIISKLDNLMKANFSNNKLDYYFLDQTIAAIGESGKEKLKLVNISLGTEYSLPVIDFENLNPARYQQSFFNFLRFEFFKWRTAEVIQEKAPNTLFFVANGNEGKWKDGSSQSSLPVDISSPFFKAVETKMKSVAPNNDPTVSSNIIGVGSLNQKGELSSYTNIILGGKNLKLFTTGEMILSPVRTYNKDYNDELRNERVGASLATAIGMGNNSRIFEKIKDSTFASLDPQDIDDFEMDVYEDMNLAASLDNFVREYEFLKFPIKQAKLSGTSMASPMATGLVASLIIEKAKSLGIPGNEIYDHPEFSVPKVIELIKQNLVEMFDNNESGISLKKLINEKFRSQSRVEADYENYLVDLESGDSAFYDEALSLAKSKKLIFDYRATTSNECNELHKRKKAR